MYRSLAASRCGRNAFDRRDMRRGVEGLGVLETVAQTVDQLFDREQSNKNATDRDRGVEGRNRSHRGHSEAGKATQEIQTTEIDETERDAEHDEPRRDLHNAPRSANQRVCYRGQIEMIVAPRRDRCAGEDRVNEESRRDLLQPQPWPADVARDDVKDDGGAKAEQQETTKEHQHGFKRVEHAPLEVTLTLENQSFSDGHEAPRRPLAARWIVGSRSTDAADQIF